MNALLRIYVETESDRVRVPRGSKVTAAVMAVLIAVVVVASIVNLVVRFDLDLASKAEAQEVVSR